MITTPKQAMLLAAGYGKRMREVNAALPKPLIEVSGRTLLDRNLDWLEKFGIEEVVINISYLAEHIEAHVKDRKKPHIQFSREPEPLETGGGIKQAMGMLKPGLFFAVNSDVILLDGYLPALMRMAQNFDPAAIDALLLVHPVYCAHGYDGRGDFLLDQEGNFRRRNQNETAPFLFAGVQLLHPRFFEGSPIGVFSMNRLYDRQANGEGWFRRMKALAHDGEWLHVGDAQGLIKARQLLT